MRGTVKMEPNEREIQITEKQAGVLMAAEAQVTQARQGLGTLAAFFLPDDCAGWDLVEIKKNGEQHVLVIQNPEMNGGG